MDREPSHRNNRREGVVVVHQAQGLEPCARLYGYASYHGGRAMTMRVMWPALRSDRFKWVSKTLRVVKSDLVFHLAVFLISTVCVKSFGIHQAFFENRLVLIQLFPGIAVTAFLMWGNRCWFGIAFGALLGNLLHATPLTFAACRAGGFVLEGIVSAYLLQRFLGLRNGIERIKTAVGFLIAAPGLAAIGGTHGAIAFAVSGEADSAWFGEVWLTCWLSSALGVLLLTPLGIALPSLAQRCWPLKRCIEGVILVSLVIGVSAFVFAASDAMGMTELPIAFLPLPLLYWAGVRFGQLGASTATLLAAALMAWGTTRSLGPFSNHPPAEMLIMMATYVVVSAIGPMLVASIVDTLEAARTDLAKLTQELQTTVRDRTRELVDTNEQLRLLLARQQLTERKLINANAELKSFAYSVSHDLRAPLRHLSGFAIALREDYCGKIGKTGVDMLCRMEEATLTMGRLIDDLLALSRVSRKQMKLSDVDLSRLATEISQALQHADPKRLVDWNIDEGLWSYGDDGLLQILLTNLLENAWKYTSREPRAKIEFGYDASDDKNPFFIRDNGIGFDASHGTKVFAPFQRMHARSQFPGTGIGLATVKRIVERHDGQIWFETEEGKGATFYFCLGNPVPHSTDRCKH
ncbi:MAG: GHKL domain-containing protein [Phycisphaera sp. RhM]|nr:GHKL domain-containing protein [Phycisphaera sp. RhM]